MDILKNAWARLTFSKSNSLPADFTAPGIEKSEQELKSERQSVSKARKYFDEFNNTCEESSKIVLAFIHHNEINTPFTSLHGEELKTRMSAGQCLHYTAAGILALQLDKKIRSIANDNSN